MKWMKYPDEKPQLKMGEWSRNVIVYGSPQCGSHSSDWQVMEAVFVEEDYFEFGEYSCPIDVSHWMPFPEPPEKE